MSGSKLQITRNSPQLTLLNITPEQAKQYVRDALERDCIVFSDHAMKRMQDRNVSDYSVRRVLEQETLAEEPTRDVRGRWTCKFEGYHGGDGVAVVIGFDIRECGSIIVVVTTFRTNNYR